jgi:O-acetyl-ADP-ribose deacetylase (regulator of RNase III)
VTEGGSLALRAFLDGRVAVAVGDITREAVDAIVNAANSTLLGGGGVDGAIHRAGGPAILAACRELRRTRWPDGLPAGEAAITTAGDLPARRVIHTVGPIYAEAGDAAPALLASCYRRALEVAAEHGLASVAFPAISTGVYGYPAGEAAAVSSRAIEETLAGVPGITLVRVVLFSADAAAAYLAAQRFSG